MDLTPNIGLGKPLPGENYDVDVQNTNMDILDGEVDGVKDNFTALRNDTIPIAKIRATSNQAVPHNTLTTVTLTGNVYDTDTMVDTPNNGLKIKTAGYYRFTARFAWESDADGYRAGLIYKSSADVYIAEDYRDAASGAATVVTITSEPLLCAVNDTFQLRAVHTAGAALDLYNANNNRAFLAAQWICNSTGIVHPV